MRDDFRRRLSAINASAKADREKNAETEAKSAAEGERKRTKVEEAIADWNSRIEPMIMRVVGEANYLIQKTGLYLIPEVTSTDMIRSTPSLPIMKIGVRPR